MQSAEQIGVVLISLGGSVATYCFTKRALAENNVFGSPKILAVCLSIICFFALVSAGPVIILPFALLGIACLLLPMAQFLIQRGYIYWPRARGQPTTTPNPPSPLPDAEARNTENPTSTFFNRPQTKKTKRQRKTTIPIEIMPHDKEPGHDR